MFALLFAARALLVLAAAAQALVLNGRDNTLSTVDLASGAPTLGALSFQGFPNQAVLSPDRLYVVISSGDEVLVADATTLVALDTLHTGVGSNPYAAAVDASGTCWVSLLGAGEVVRFDALGAETGRAGVGRSPEGVLLAGGRLFVANSGFRFSDFGYDPGTVTVLDALTLAPVATVGVGVNPQWMAKAGNEIHVMCTGDYFSTFGQVHILDAGTLAPLDTVSLGGSPGFLVAGQGQGFATDYSGGIYAYDLASRAVLHDATNPIVVGGRGYSGLVLDDAGGLLVTLFEDDALARVRVADGALDAVYATGDGPVNVVVRREEPVPVRPSSLLLSFTATLTPHGVEIEWRVVEDQDVAAYFLDRRDASAWERMATRPGEARGRAVDSGTTSENLTYRLSVLRRDGTVEVLGETHMRPREDAGLSVRVLTNPVRRTLQLQVDGATSAAGRIEVFDARGRIVMTSTGNGNGTVNTLDTTPLAAGVYVVRVVDKKIAFARFVVLP